MAKKNNEHGELTANDDYAERLVRLQEPNWKKRLRFLDPYRWNVRKLCVGRVLEIGCGVGRNLDSLRGRSVGVDHNLHAVDYAKRRGLEAYSTEHFLALSKEFEGSFDTLLLAHLLEHISESAQQELLATYLPFLKPGGKVVVICPQEWAYRTDSTHIRWVDFAGINDALEFAGTTNRTFKSFPFPRWARNLYIYNEFIGSGHIA